MGTLSFDAASGGSIGVVGSDTASVYQITVPATNGILTTKNSATGALNLSVGTTAQRPVTPIAGYLRFNTTLSVVEFYNGTAWVTL
jgi:hypothetical protein